MSKKLKPKQCPICGLIPEIYDGDIHEPEIGLYNEPYYGVKCVNWCAEVSIRSENKKLGRKCAVHMWNHFVLAFDISDTVHTFDAAPASKKNDRRKS